MKGLSAHEAKKSARTDARPVTRPEIKYTVDGTLYSFSELVAAVQAVNPDVGESKIRARLSRGHRSMSVLTAGNLPQSRPWQQGSKFR